MIIEEKLIIKIKLFKNDALQYYRVTYLLMS